MTKFRLIAEAILGGALIAACIFGIIWCYASTIKPRCLEERVTPKTVYCIRYER